MKCLTAQYLTDTLALLRKEIPEPAPVHRATTRHAGPESMVGRLSTTPGDVRVRAYVEKCSPAVSGQHGHDATMKFAAKLIRGFNLTPDRAMPFAMTWNERCNPPWSSNEIYRKLCEADKHPGPRGFLITTRPTRATKRIRLNQPPATPPTSPLAAPPQDPGVSPVNLPVIPQSAENEDGSPASHFPDPDVHNPEDDNTGHQHGHESYTPNPGDIPTDPTTPVGGDPAMDLLLPEIPPKEIPVARLSNYEIEEVPSGETMRQVKVSRRAVDILAELQEWTGGWPKRIGALLFAPNKDGTIEFYKHEHALFAWIDWQYAQDNGAGFDWTDGGGFISTRKFYETCCQQCEAFKSLELYPHEPQIPGHFYYHPEIDTSREVADGKTLTQLISMFNPDTPEDEELIRAFFMTLVWGGDPCTRPLFLFEASEHSANKGRGSGKSTVATVGASLVGGYLDINQNDKTSEIKARLLTPDAFHKRVAIIDNLKSHRFSDSGLEAMVTSPIISGKMMYVGEACKPNTMTWVITANDPSVSKDLADRSIIIRILRPNYSPSWLKAITTFIEQNRWRIFGDIIAELRRPSNLEGNYVYSRWAPWEEAVLGKLCEPDKIAREIAVRRGLVDDDKEVESEVLSCVEEMLQEKGFDPDTDTVLIPAEILVDKVVRPFQPDKAKNRSVASRWFNGLKIANMVKYTERRPCRGIIWISLKSFEAGERNPMLFRHYTTGEPFRHAKSQGDEGNDADAATELFPE